MMNLPNKLFDYLASERPVIVAGYGETAELVQRAGAGRVVESEDAAGMAQAIVELASLSEGERTVMGEAGRRYALEHYNREKLGRVFLDVLQCAVHEG